MNFQRNMIDNIFSSLFPNSMNSANLGQGENDTIFEQIIDFLMRNDPNTYGTPPASKDAIENLKKIKYIK